MADNRESDGNDWLTQLLSQTDIITRSIQAVLGIAGVIGLARMEWDKNPLVLVFSLFVIIVSGTWFALGAYLRRRRPRRAMLLSGPHSSSSYLRGFLPFEKGDHLLGRDQELGLLLALLRSLEYRFGFLSGEAGSGKTSLIRARLLPELETSGFHPVYVPRTGADPDLAIRKAFASAGVSQSIPPNCKLSDLIRAAAISVQGKTLFLIIDQFEEFYIANRTRELRVEFEKTLFGLVTADLPLRVLFAMRKEFVDDLLDLGKVIPDLQSSQRRMPLRNFHPDTARAIVGEIVAKESLRFSDELQDLVIFDLVRDQRIRPVELQLVFTTLLNQSVFDVAAYRAVDGAQGVIARFIKETLDPPDLKTDELERRVGRYTLRALCHGEFITRRAIGLSRAELLERLQADHATGRQLTTASADVEAALDRVLRRLLDGYILILEDEEKINLAHDYLALPIRDATADVETIEEQATRVLEQYLGQLRTDRHLLLPWRTLRFVQRFANRESLARSDAESLLRRSWLRHYATAAGVCAGALLLITVLLPFGFDYPERERVELRGVNTVSRDGRLVIARNGDEATIVRVDAPKFRPRRLSIAVKDIIANSTGDAILVLGTNGALYQIHVDDELKPRKLLDDTGWTHLQMQGRWGGFSPDGSWVYAAIADGRIFAWPLNGRPQELVRLATLSDSWGKAVSIGEAHSGREMIPPELGMTESGRWLWVVDGNGRLFVLNPTQRPDASLHPVEVLEPSFSNRYNRRVFTSEDGKWLAFNDRSGNVRVARLTAAGLSSAVEVITYGDTAKNNTRLDVTKVYFSNNSKWLLGRRVFGNYYVVELLPEIKPAMFPALDLPPASGGDFLGPVDFDLDGKYVAGTAQDQLIYIWPLRTPPRTTAQPALSTHPNTGWFLSENQQNVIFCPEGQHVVVSGGDGTVHSAPLTGEPIGFSQVGRLAVGDVQFLTAVDRHTLIAYDTVRLAAGTCGYDLQNITEADSTILRVVSDGRGNLVIVTENDLTRLGRAFYIWGIAVWTHRWPDFHVEKLDYSRP